MNDNWKFSGLPYTSPDVEALQARYDALTQRAKDAQDPEDLLEVEIPPQWLENVPPHRREALRGVLAQDPRPRYQEDPQRVYGFGFAGLEVRFRVEDGRAIVEEILPGTGK